MTTKDKDTKKDNTPAMVSLSEHLHARLSTLFDIEQQQPQQPQQNQRKDQEDKKTTLPTSTPSPSSTATTRSTLPSQKIKLLNDFNNFLKCTEKQSDILNNEWKSLEEKKYLDTLKRSQERLAGNGGGGDDKLEMDEDDDEMYKASRQKKPSSSSSSALLEDNNNNNNNNNDTYSNKNNDLHSHRICDKYVTLHNNPKIPISNPNIMENDPRPTHRNNIHSNNYNSNLEKSNTKNVAIERTGGVCLPPIPQWNKHFAKGYAVLMWVRFHPPPIIIPPSLDGKIKLCFYKYIIYFCSYSQDLFFFKVFKNDIRRIKIISCATKFFWFMFIFGFVPIKIQIVQEKLEHNNCGKHTPTVRCTACNAQ